MKIIYKKQAEKVLDRMDVTTNRRVKDAIEKLPEGDVRRIIGRPEQYRLRVGDWRIAFIFINKETIAVEYISSRGNIYKRV